MAPHSHERNPFNFDLLCFISTDRLWVTRIIDQFSSFMGPLTLISFSAEVRTLVITSVRAASLSVRYNYVNTADSGASGGATQIGCSFCLITVAKISDLPRICQCTAVSTPLKFWDIFHHPCWLCVSNYLVQTHRSFWVAAHWVFLSVLHDL